MNRITLIGICMFFGLVNAYSQQWSTGIAYQNLYSPQWDKAIQTLNFSRPFLEKKQPLLIHGANLELNYFFDSNSRWESGIKLEYGFIRSNSDNTNFQLAFNLHQAELAYILRYSLENQLKGFLLELTPSVFGTLLSRRVNGEIDEVDDDNNIALGIGGNLGLTSLYQVKLKNEKILLPFIGIEYAPYLYSPKSIALLNQVTVDESIQIISWKIGIRFVIKN